MSEAEAIILTLIGVGIIVVGIMIVQELQALQIKQQAAKEKDKIVVREDVVLPMADGIPRWAPWWQPYWSYVPVRPFLY